MTLPNSFARRSGFLAAGWMLLLATAPAQVAPKVATTPQGNTLVELSPFVVSTERDNGWVASTSLIGTRTNEQLVNLPLSVDALTADFMRDVGIYLLEDASAMIANTV